MPSRGKRDLPPTKDIEDVLTAFCTKTKLNPLGLTLNVTGGDWNHRIHKIGVRVVGFNDNNPHSVHVLIGCKNNSVRGYITYREGDTGVKANELYSRISRLFQGNEKFISTETDEEKKVAALEKSEVAEAVAPEPTPAEAETPAPASGFAPEKTNRLETNSDTTNGSHISFRNFFDSEANMHLGVVALVSEFTTTSKLFSFKEFTSVLRNEVGVGLEAVKMASIAGKFTRSGYIARRNKPPLQARYTLTEKAFAFAEQTPKSKAPKKVRVKAVRVETLATEKVPDEPPKCSTNGAATPIAELIGKFTELQRSENEYQRIVEEIGKNNRRLAGFNLPELAKEDAALVKEIAVLEEKIAGLKKRRGQIENIGVRAHMAQTEINAFEETIRTNGLLEKHHQFKEMEAQLHQLQVLLKKSA